MVKWRYGSIHSQSLIKCQGYIAPQSQPQHQLEVSGQLQAPSTLLQGKSWDRKLGGPQGWSGCCGEHKCFLTLPEHKRFLTLPEHKRFLTLPEHKCFLTLPEHKCFLTLPEHKCFLTLPEIAPSFLGNGETKKDNRNGRRKGRLGYIFLCHQYVPVFLTL